MTRLIVVVVCLLFISTGTPAFAVTAPTCDALAKELELDPPSPIPDAHCHLEDGCLSVDWNVVNEQQLTEVLKIHRITEKTALKVRTYNVNRMGYVVNWITKVERQDQAFESLSSMFDKVFPLLSLLPGGAAFTLSGEDGDPLKQWVVPLEHAQTCLSETLIAFTDIVLDHDGTANRDRLHVVEQILTQAMPKLSVRRQDYLAAITAASNLAAEKLSLYWKIAERHADLEKRAAEFLPLARASVEGTETSLGAEKRNSVVTLTGRAAKRTGEPVGEAVTAQYFVTTERPLIYHIGYGYGRLKDFDFKQVRSVSGQDLFAATTSSGNQSEAGAADTGTGVDAIAFLTWEFLSRGPNGRYGTGLTFGTGLKSPGTSVYYGGSIRVFSRLLISGGVVTAKATRGTSEVQESTPGGSIRTLFAGLTDKTATRPFWSVSFKVY